ncbi:condensation domain-containing protein, partial [Sphingomonas sp. LB2R24]|uniref:condensation domain-containing protein n=1 Tax=Sphingomonas sorbitolis TaxID=3096165 RepID=UPI002FCBF455
MNEQLDSAGLSSPGAESNRKKLLNLWLRRAAGTIAPPIDVAQRPSTLLLSYAQERLWFLEELGHAGAAYNMPLSLRLTGVLDTDALEASLAELVRRHESLRTGFGSETGKPFQCIAPAVEMPLAVVDLTLLVATEQDAEVRRLVQAEVDTPFDFSADSLFRRKLLRLSGESHILLMTMHHIVSDGWSLGVLVRELGALYEAYSQGRSSPLPEPRLQYADYALWQRDWLN